MSRKMQDNKKYGLALEAEIRATANFSASTDALRVKFSQRILANGVAEFWDSVVVEGYQEQDGTLALRVYIFNPEWPEPLQIAHLRSRPDDPNCLTPLSCNLDHISVFATQE